MIEMFHNGGYALCDVAPQHRENMNDINTVQRERQYLPASAFHDARPGVASRLEGPLSGHPGGKIGRRSSRWCSPLSISHQTTACPEFLFS